MYKKQTFQRITKETQIHIDYSFSSNGKCKIQINGKGDFKHHLIEDIIILLGEKFDMLDHVYLGGINSKIRQDLAKEV
jgi:imidazoleglycerol phosphate dehydratase HisB